MGKNLILTTLLSLYVVFAALYTPLSILFVNNELILTAISVIACGLSIVALTFAAGSFKSILGYAITIIALTFFGASPYPISLIASYIGGVCVYSYLLIRHKSAFLYGVPAIAPILLVLLIVRYPIYIVLSVAWIPCSLLLTYAVKKRLDRVSAVCHISFGICIAIVVFLSIFVYLLHGSITPSAFRAFIDELKLQTISIMHALMDEMTKTVGEMPVDLTGYIETAVITVFNLIPAIIIIVGNIGAYIIHSTLLSVTYNAEKDREKLLPMLSFEMSFISAILFSVSLILSFVLTTNDTAFYGAVAENLMLVLAPGLILTALGALRMLTTRNGPSCLGSIIYFGVIMMLCSLSLPAIFICSIAGAVIVVLSHIAKWRSKKD